MSQDTSLSTDDSGKLLLMKFLSNSDKVPDPIENANKEWEHMYKEFNALQATKDNKIPQSEFEAKYSIFFNPENMDTFNEGSETAYAWKQRSEEFLRRINPYCPFYVVDDHDHDKILKVFPPIFHEVDTLNTPNLGKNRPIVKDDEGNIIDTAYITGVVNNVFDKFGNHQLQSKRQEGAKILNNCLMHVQDKSKLVEDVKNTDVILHNFIAESRSGSTRSDGTEKSAEDFGIQFDED